MKLEKYSFGVGDRFGRQAKAQLRAFVTAQAAGADVVPVWNKSHLEHTAIGSDPGSVRLAADAAVKELGWTKSYYVDANHVRRYTVQGYIESSDFFTIDVADGIGQFTARSEVEAFLDRHSELRGAIKVPGIHAEFEMPREDVPRMIGRYMNVVRNAGAICRVIRNLKGADEFITEVSMDETHRAQTPAELLLILAAFADEKLPLQTIAPKFTGRFNKGVDFVGDIAQFEKELDEHIAVIAYAVERYGLPDNLKLSIHSGSDKFSIYPAIRRVLARTGAGIHIKTAGTTWLEELIGLAEAGGDGLAFAKRVYTESLERRDELCAPYTSVIDIDAERLPSAGEVNGWTSEQFAAALRSDESIPAYNPYFRQLLHVGYKVAAHRKDEFLRLLDRHEDVVAASVTDNIYRRHIKPLFVDRD